MKVIHLLSDDPLHLRLLLRKGIFTYRLVDLEDMRWGVKIRLELIDNYMQAADLVPHCTGHLDKSQLEASVSYTASGPLHDQWKYNNFNILNQQITFHTLIYF